MINEYLATYEKQDSSLDQVIIEAYTQEEATDKAHIHLSYDRRLKKVISVIKKPINYKGEY